jgi:hypothetical protein
VDAINGKTPHKRKIEKRVQQCISKNVCLEHGNKQILMTISPRCLEIKTADTNEVVARHEMPKISFASGGDGVSMSLNVAKVSDWFLSKAETKPRRKSSR